MSKINEKWIGQKNPFIFYIWRVESIKWTIFEHLLLIEQSGPKIVLGLVSCVLLQGNVLNGWMEK